MKQFEIINIERLREDKDNLKLFWNSQAPFRFLVMEDFFRAEEAEKILQNYPKIKDAEWDGTTYINQKNKYQLREFPEGSIIQKTFNELNDPEFIAEIEYITGMPDLKPDYKLFGGGLHQSTAGAFLDVHVDFNIHPETRYHRRLNILIYMNKDWKNEYEGFLQLWDMKEKKMIGNIAPIFNRMAMFETNEISYHGHPIPLKTPPGVSRKSLAGYYYSETRPEHEIAKEHSTIHVHPNGKNVNEVIKNSMSAVKAIKERLFKPKKTIK